MPLVEHDDRDPCAAVPRQRARCSWHTAESNSAGGCRDEVDGRGTICFAAARHSFYQGTFAVGMVALVSITHTMESSMQQLVVDDNILILFFRRFGMITFPAQQATADCALAIVDLVRLLPRWPLEPVRIALWSRQRLHEFGQRRSRGSGTAHGSPAGLIHRGKF
jgi:hypothetical protein